MAKMLAPKLGERIADLACGTGGFLTSMLKELEGQVNSTDDKAQFNAALYGCEKKALPYLLCVTNLLLHDIDNPNVRTATRWNAAFRIIKTPTALTSSS